MTGPVRRIVFTGDFLRPSHAKMQPTQHENIVWLAQLLRVPVEMATELHCDTVHWDHRWEHRPVLDQEAVRAIYRAFWLPETIDSWARIYDRETLPAPVEALFEQLFEGSFVIGFELPPYLKMFFDRQGIDYIDCSISHIRFMDDLLFDFTPSDAATLVAFAPHTVSDALIRLQAGVTSAHVAKLYPNPPRFDTLLVILQTKYDKVLVQDGRFVSMLDFLQDLEEIARDYTEVWIKQHPLEPQPDVLAQLLARLPGARTTQENFYRLVAHPNLAGVVALSSSCVHEARCFGKKGHFLMPRPVEQERNASTGATIGDAIITADFWRDVLSISGLAVTARDGITLPSKPNRFRLQLRSAWAYNEIDSDIAVNWAKNSLDPP